MEEANAEPSDAPTEPQVGSWPRAAPVTTPNWVPAAVPASPAANCTPGVTVPPDAATLSTIPPLNNEPPAEAATEIVAFFNASSGLPPRSLVCMYDTANAAGGPPTAMIPPPTAAPSTPFQPQFTCPVVCCCTTMLMVAFTTAAITNTAIADLQSGST